jgi:multisubunit Na+/H+ antiporter MnhB subunit
MIEFTTMLDVVLAILTISLAWSSLNCQSLRQGVTLFIVLGLVVALVWARLAAPDLAIAEVAIGSGITGALLIAAMHDMRTEQSTLDRPGLALTVVINGVTIGLTLLVAFAFFSAVTSAVDTRLEGQVVANLDRSGVSNPVTAVLLNYRSYDTLLELLVLLAAALGIRAIGVALPVPRAVDPLLNALIGLLVPALIMMGLYLLWVGAKSPGGAFQAAAVLAAGLVLMRLGGQDVIGKLTSRLFSFALVSGAAVFLIVGLLVGEITGVFLQFPEAWSGVLILVIEVFATISIAAALGLAFVGGDVIQSSVEPPGDV